MPHDRLYHNNGDMPKYQTIGGKYGYSAYLFNFTI